MGDTAIDRLLADITAGMGIAEGVFAADAVLDATVPNWRFSLAGEGHVRHQLSQWYADPGTFEEIDRTPVSDGEVVRFLLTWTERGELHAAHQAHLLQVREDRIVSDTMFCGGRWSAPLLAKMAS